MLISTISINSRGSTTLSNHISRQFNLGYSTDTIENKVLLGNHPNYIHKFNNEDIKTNHIVFDIGDIKNKNTENILKSSDLIIIVAESKPSTEDLTNILLSKLSSIGVNLNNILLVINKVKNTKKYLSNYNKIKTNYCNKGLEEDKIFMIRESELLSNSLYEGKTVFEVVESSKLLNGRKDKFVILKNMEELDSYINDFLSFN